MPAPPSRTPPPRNSSGTVRKAPHGVLQVDWPFFGELCRALALKIFREYDPDVVIGIARAGVIPGAVVASILQRDFASVAITRQETGARPVVLAGPPRIVTGRRVLIVDETCDSGDTMKLALNAVRELKPAAVKTAVSFRTGEYRPTSTRSRPRTSSSFPGTARSSSTGRSWCAPTTPRSSRNW